MMMNGSQTQEGDRTLQVTIVLPLGAWDTILGMIAERPWKDADPYMRELRRQIHEVLHVPRAGDEQPQA